MSLRLETAVYPDSEVGALVSAASRQTGLPAEALLEDFGAFIAPDLLEMYWAAVQPEWRTLDLLENTEKAIHTWSASVRRARHRRI